MPAVLTVRAPALQPVAIAADGTLPSPAELPLRGAEIGVGMGAR